MGILKKISDPAAQRRNENTAAETEALRAEMDYLNLLNGVEGVSDDDDSED